MSKEEFNQIKAVLTDKQFDAKELAKYMGVTTKTINNWCRNSTQPTVHMLFKIAQILKVQPSDLLVGKAIKVV